MEMLKFASKSDDPRVTFEQFAEIMTSIRAV